MSFQRLKDLYPTSEPSQQERIRDLSFEESVEVQRLLSGQLDALLIVVARFEDLEAFVTANSLDYTATERSDLQAVRTAFITEIATVINSITGVTASVT